MDHRRFLKYFLETEGFLKSYLLASTGSSQDAEDLLQEVSAVLWEIFDRYDPARPFRAWAVGIAHLEVLKWRQRRARSREVLSEGAIEALAQSASEQAGESEPNHLFLGSCLQALADPLREILNLRYVESLPIVRIAERVGKTVGAIEMTLVRIRRALRECVDRKALEQGEAADER